MLRHLAGLAEIVDDVDAAVAFYTETLGLTVEKRDSDDYVMLSAPGVLHFGIWSRAHAAESMFGDREQADRVPLGYTIEFEVDDVAETASTLDDAGRTAQQPPRTEPWGQKSLRMLSPGGSVLGFAETPWARTLVRAPATEANPG